MTTTTLNRRQFRWALVLVEYDFEIKYCVEKTNPVDGSSRRPDYEGEEGENICLFILQNKLKNVTIVALGVSFVLTRRFVVGEATKAKATEFISRIVEVEDDEEFENEETDVVPGAEDQQFRRSEARAICDGESHYEFSSEVLMIKLVEMQFGDSVVQKVREQLASEEHRKACAERGWVIRGSLLYFFRVIYVFNEAALKAELFRLYHDDSLAGHFGIKKTRDFIGRKYFWLRMIVDVDEYVKGCDVC